jgi:drug/metabolite transporter (DMT)-like permease
VNIKRINWTVWLGLLLSIFAFLSYYFIFVWIPFTRDFPWANLLLFGAAIVLLLLGLRRAFTTDRPRRAKVGASLAFGFGLLVSALFVFSFFVGGRWLPASLGAPLIGQKAPEFSLPDTNKNTFTLSGLLSSPINNKAPRGVLLIFYRGYW